MSSSYNKIFVLVVQFQITYISSYINITLGLEQARQNSIAKSYYINFSIISRSHKNENPKDYSKECSYFGNSPK